MGIATAETRLPTAAVVVVSTSTEAWLFNEGGQGVAL